MAGKRKPKRTGAMLLTDTKVKRAKPGRHADGRGLYLLVKPSGSRSWLLRYQLDGRRREAGLGPYPAVSLARAREKAGERLVLIKDHKIDPLAKRSASVRRLTFQAAAEALIESKKPGWKNGKHAAQWTATLQTYAYPILSKLDVSVIDTDDVLSVLTPIWTTKTETASRVRQRIENVLDYARARGRLQGENPARWRGHLDKLLASPEKVRRTRHHAALPWQEMGAFMAELHQQQGLAAKALELTILTACRSGEVLNARWDELDLQTKTWTIPRERMKADEEHRVPLSEAAVELLKAIPKLEGNEFLFPGQKEKRPLSNMAMAKVLERMGRTDITVHGFRSTFRDWAGESTNFPRELAEKALAHIIGDETERAYQRGDLLERRRKVMTAWANWCNRPADENKVVGILG